ncbi:IS701 family transposase [Actinoallomurus bryophytorum]
MDRVVVDVVAAELDRVHVRMAGRFTRSEPRERVREYVSGLVAGLERKNGWTLAERSGAVSPDGMRRQFSGAAGRTENCQIGTFSAYAAARGHALVDRELYLPESWTDDRQRCRAAGIPEEVAFATRPRQAMAMPARAFAARVPFARVTADEAYGQVKYLRVWLEERDASYVPATRRTEVLITTTGHQRQADQLVADLGARAWRRIFGRCGSHGPREYDWARIPIRIGWARGRGHWLPARRSISHPDQIAYYVCYGPHRSSLADLAWIAGAPLRIEEC